jgi:hypothetical protein
MESARDTRREIRRLHLQRTHRCLEVATLSVRKVLKAIIKAILIRLLKSPELEWLSHFSLTVRRYPLARRF